MSIDKFNKTIFTCLHIESQKIEDPPIYSIGYYAISDIWGGELQPKYKLKKDIIVLAIPSGGVPVGIKIAEKMQSSFDLVIVRKMQIPGNTEAGFGAMAYDGSVFLNESLLQRIDLKPSQIEEQANIVKKELEKRNKMFRQGKPFPELTGKTVILVDDGLASGYTMMASIYMVKKMGALKTVVAVPTAPLRSLEEVETGVEEIYCANIRQGPVFLPSLMPTVTGMI